MPARREATLKKLMEPEEKKREKVLTPEELEIARRFSIVVEHFYALAIKEKKKITDIDLNRYEKLAQEKEGKLTIPERFIQLVNTALATKGTADYDLDALAKISLSIRPRPLAGKGRPSEEFYRVVREMVSTKMPGMPELTEEAVRAAISLAVVLEEHDVNKFNEKRWTKERVA